MTLFIILIFILFCSVATAKAASEKVDELKHGKERGRAIRLFRASVVVVTIVLSSILLLILGYVWYFFCGGLLVLNDADSVGEFILYALISLMLLAFFIGFIAICCGWDPDSTRK